VRKKNNNNNPFYNNKESLVYFKSIFTRAPSLKLLMILCCQGFTQDIFEFENSSQM